MSQVLPFRALRPAPDKVHLVTSNPVDFYSTHQLNSKLKENPYSFLHVVKPDHGSERKTRPGSIENLHLIRNKFGEFCEKEFLQRDTAPCYYLYRQIQPGGSFTGLIACASVDEYNRGLIRRHEQTLSKKEEKLKDYLSVCSFNAEPVSLTYPADPVIDNLTNHYITSFKPVYDFTTTDRNRHQLWPICRSYDVELIARRFKGINHVYIADGHHRSASSARLAAERCASSHHDPHAGYNYFMAIYFPDHQLKVFEYNRMISDLGEYTAESFLNELKKVFRISKPSRSPLRPSRLHQYALCLEGTWYLLELDETVVKGKDPAASLDAALLSDLVLAPMLGIRDLRNDDRVSFIAGTHGPEGMQKVMERKKHKAGFALYPVSMDQLYSVADADLTMPPKSTWIEPKLRNALVVLNLDETL